MFIFCRWHAACSCHLRRQSCADSENSLQGDRHLSYHCGEHHAHLSDRISSLPTHSVWHHCHWNSVRHCLPHGTATGYIPASLSKSRATRPTRSSHQRVSRPGHNREGGSGTR
uniref:Uncharacterized protein n=1 Tax=Cacopsylla melanoneura TaxID=428564 RepID=A0A8D8ZL75_9HEMI